MKKHAVSMIDPLDLRAMAILLWHNNALTQQGLSKFLKLRDYEELEHFWLLNELSRYAPNDVVGIARGHEIEEEYNLCQVRILCVMDEDYPRQLLGLRNAPPILSVKGNGYLLMSPQIAMVGSRELHPLSRSIAKTIADHLLRRGFVLTSGGALGIDALAHRQAMNHHVSTVIVTGTGLDEIYPRENRAIFDYASLHGAIVSQYPFHTPATRTNFPSRNAVIAGLSLACIIVQCREKSGALYTAHFSQQYKRPVFVAAMPGFDALTEGALKLVKTGKARLLSQPSDLDDLGTGIEKIHTTQQKSLDFVEPEDEKLCSESNHDDDSMTEAQKSLWMIVKRYPQTRENLRQMAIENHFPAENFDETLLDLELMGRIDYLGGQYMVSGG